jgi:hypothetical protein
MRKLISAWCLAAALLSCGVSSALQAAPLIAIEFDTGNLYSVSTDDASLALIGDTGLTGVGALEFNPVDGFFYATTTGPTAALYRIDISPVLDSIENVTLVGPLGINSFEGALAFAPDGTAYGVNEGVTNVASLYTLNLSTGAASVVGPIVPNDDPLDRHKISGLGWRSDGMLVGLDGTAEDLVSIDPQSTILEQIAGLTPTLGSVGGMTILDGTGYFVTAGPNAAHAGSNALYSFDLFTGQQSFIGSFDGIVTGTGFAGVSIIPEPATLTLLVIGAFAGAFRRRIN